MQQSEFEAMLAKEQFDQVATVEREANKFIDVHSHPFDAKALILEGEISIGTDGGERVYKAGDIFHVVARTPHTERYGPAGVRYLVGKKPGG